MSGEEYNGWPNRETWAVNLWFSNDEGLYNSVTEMTAEAIDEATEEDDDEKEVVDRDEAVSDLTTKIESFFDMLHGFMRDGQANEVLRTMMSDVGTVSRVDWEHIAATWVDEEIENRAAS